MMKFREEINGLRAIAILGVVLFHSKMSLFSGGYIGVDIFFVISGYLISFSILKEIKNKKFSFNTFYLKRFLRIFPALFTMVFICTIFFGFILIPNEYETFGSSLAAQSIFLSNIYFMLTSGYFDLGTEFRPLLHTWSLGVEEQFYLFFPIILYLSIRYLKKYRSYLFLIILTIISFIYSSYLININPNSQFYFFGLFENILSLGTNASAGFYFFFSRAWQFILGSILAYSIVYNLINYKKISKNYPHINNLIGYLGFAGIILPIFFYDDSTSFPGIYAVIPTIGTLFIIFSNITKQNIIGKMLSLPFFSFFGNISYSLYLWHWPIMVLIVYIYGKEHSLLATLIGITVSILISFLSYIFIEKNFKYNREKKYSTIKLNILFICIMLVFSSTGLVIKINKGLPERLPKNINQYASYSNVSDSDIKKCHNLTIDTLQSSGPCILGNEKKNITFIVIGDSHALALLQTLNKLSINNNIAGYFISKDGCKPFNMPDANITIACKNTRMYTQKLLHNKKNIKNILYVYSWNLYIDGYKDISIIKQYLEKILPLGKDIWIMKQIPQLDVNPPGYIVRKAWYTKESPKTIEKEIAITKEEYLKQNSGINTFLENIKNKKFHVIDPTQLFFKEDYSKVVNNNDILYRDNNHINKEGAEFIKSIFTEFFKNVKKEQ